MKDLLKFIRPQICISTAFLAISGCMLFNAPVWNTILAAISSFLICASVYSYNNITDRKEDLKNRKRINRYVKDGGMLIVSATAVSGITFSLLASAVSAAIALLFLFTGFAYSGLRIKKYCAVKNIYTAFLITQIFALGSFAGQFPPVIGLALYSSFFFGIILSGSLISDLRDYEGDRAAGVRTIPVVFSAKTSKALAASVLMMLAATVFASGAGTLLIFVPLCGISLVLILKERYSLAHLSGMAGMVLLPMWLAIL
jgi:4-hydroxybenzoate polyprenyltransferase